MKQIYENYNAEDFEVWKVLFQRQKENLRDKACMEYLGCLDKMSHVLHENKIPVFEELSQELMDATGWSIEVVPGIVPVDEFFELLSKKRFCSSTWLRSKSQLDYLEEPDMFHDIFGHIPLFMDPDYANYAEKIGQLGVKYRHNEKIVSSLQSLYWFTIEFGLISRGDELEIYGAGIISSFGETNHIYSDEVEIYSFFSGHSLQWDRIHDIRIPH